MSRKQQWRAAVLTVGLAMAGAVILSVPLLGAPISLLLVVVPIALFGVMAVRQLVADVRAGHDEVDVEDGPRYLYLGIGLTLVMVGELGVLVADPASGRTVFRLPVTIAAGVLLISFGFVVGVQLMAGSRRPRPQR